MLLQYSVGKRILCNLHGVHVRCYAASAFDTNFLIIYGRFDRVRGTAAKIHYELTQHAISFLGIDKIVGIFVTGSVKKNISAGTVYIPHDFVGLGGYQQTMSGESDFRNVDMFNPFCNTLRAALIASSSEFEFTVNPQGIYACFHGFPRIETKAELEFYSRNGWDIVGQTLDPEATLAREAGCHYAAIAATIDDWVLREKFLQNNEAARDEIDSNIEIGRKRAFRIFLKTLPAISNMITENCCCESQSRHFKKRSKHFFYRPGFLCE